MGERVPETEQWLLDGDCSKCRRAEYCSKQCMKNKQSVKNYVFSGLDMMLGLSMFRTIINRRQ